MNFLDKTSNFLKHQLPQTLSLGQQAASCSSLANTLFRVTQRKAGPNPGVLGESCQPREETVSPFQVKTAYA